MHRVSAASSPTLPLVFAYFLSVSLRRSQTFELTNSVLLEQSLILQKVDLGGVGEFHEASDAILIDLQSLSLPVANYQVIEFQKAIDSQQSTLQT